MSKWPIYLFQVILQISHWSSRVKKIYKNPLKFPIIICTISSPLIFHFPITNEQAKIALKFVKTWNFLSRITKISSFLQSRKHTQYAPGSNSLRERGGTITNTPFHHCDKRSRNPPLPDTYRRGIMRRRRGERRKREKGEAYSRGGEANRVIWQGCLQHRGRGIINFNYTTRREAAWRKGSRNKLTATASVPNPTPSLHQPTTYHIAHTSASSFHFHQHRLSNTPASPSSIRSGITWVLIKRNASHPLRTGRGREVAVEGAFGTGVGRQLILFIDVLIGRPHLTADFNPWGLKAGVGNRAWLQRRNMNWRGKTEGRGWKVFSVYSLRRHSRVVSFYGRIGKLIYIW